MTYIENQYPIGPYIAPHTITEQMRSDYLQSLAEFPQQLLDIVQHLNEQQLDLTYRPGSWTLRQVVHHIADANLNQFPRIKMALSENVPTIKPYNEVRWTEFIDARTAPIMASIKILEGLHLRWVLFLQSLNETEWKTTFFHPEFNRPESIEMLVDRLVWHENHHLAQIKNAIKKQLC